MAKKILTVSAYTLTTPITPPLTSPLVSPTATPTAIPTIIPSPTATPTIRPTATPTPISYGLNIIAPNGNESLSIGSTITIKWSSTKNFAKLDLYYAVSGGWSGNIVTGLTNDTGVYSWTVNPLYGLGSYKIYIMGYDKNGYNVANDSSDNYFSVIKNNPTPTPTIKPTAIPTKKPTPTPTKKIIPTPTQMVCRACRSFLCFNVPCNKI